MATSSDALQQRRSLSHRSSRLMRLRTCVAIEPRLIGLEGDPIDEARMMVRNEDRPLVHGEMTHAFLDHALFIDVTLAPALAISVSASIHRIGQDRAKAKSGGWQCRWG